MRHLQLLGLMLFAFGTWPVAHARAAVIEDVAFADTYRAGDAEMVLNCVGLLRYKIFIKAYVAGLYLGRGVEPQAVFEDVPKRLEINYFWNLRGADIAKAGGDILARNVSTDSLAALRPRLDQINGLYEDVQPGDRYSLTYVPGSGTELAKNGRRLGVVPGADFAAAYFRIWLGEDPIDESFRDQLLACDGHLTDDRQARVEIQ